MTGQMSESRGLGILLALSGGLMDAYSYLFRGEVFANAQTGNILLFSVYLTQRQWSLALFYLCPLLAFSLGIGFSAVVRHLCRERHFHWRQLCVLLEIVILALAAPLPPSADLLSNSLISLACGAQVESFRTISGSSVATTMCIGNLRMALHNAGVSFTIILAFAIGAILGGALLPVLGRFTLWVSVGLLTVTVILMVVRPQPETP